LAEAPVGYLNIVWLPEYGPFREDGIPEIQDFNVAAGFRRQGIGSGLMDEAERCCLLRSSTVGIAVGLDPDYGPAQRLYVRRGYVPDGRGLHYGNRPVRWGETVTVDDSLILYLTKSLGR
ncbi:MAG: GNAT family N-acetyltransferase, partial [Capsulimonadales bacterium]|nr:GNAT family N-acetyltransferase [Capsulimonadales bacterium]